MSDLLEKIELINKERNKYSENLNEYKTRQKEKLEGVTLLIENDMHVEQTGLSVICYENNRFGFNWDTYAYKGNEITKEQVKQIAQAFPISRNEEDNYEVAFADKNKNIKTDSSLCLKYNSKEQYVKICWSSFAKKDSRKEKTKVLIEVSVPISWFKNHVFQQKFSTKKNFGHIDKSWTETQIQNFYSQRFHGGHNVLYFLDGAETIAEYENFCLTGEFIYEDEIN